MAEGVQEALEQPVQQEQQVQPVQQEQQVQQVQQQQQQQQVRQQQQMQPVQPVQEQGSRKPPDWQLRDFWAEHGDKRGVPQGVRDLLNAAFSKVAVSSFPELPTGHVLEVPGDASIADAVNILAQNNIYSAPVTNPRAAHTDPWSTRYLGMVDYPAVIMWVLEQAEIAAAAHQAGTTAAVGVGAGAVGALGAVVMGLTGPVTVAAVSAAAIGTAIAAMSPPLAEEKVKEKYRPFFSGNPPSGIDSGRAKVNTPESSGAEVKTSESGAVAVETAGGVGAKIPESGGVGQKIPESGEVAGKPPESGGLAVEARLTKDVPSPTNAMGQKFYQVILREEPFQSTKVPEITKAYRWAPFLPIQEDDNMLTVLLLLSKFQLRSIPVVNHNDPTLKNIITQTAVVRGLSHCSGRDWFDSLASKSLFQIGLPLMTPDKVVTVDANQLVIEAFRLMKAKGVGGLPVVEGPEKKLKGNISIRDVRFLLLQPDLFARRREVTVMEFMKSVKWAAPDMGLLPALTCNTDSTLGEAIELLATHNYHRIYVVSRDPLHKDHVQGVITLRDIIGCFVSEPEGYFANYFGGTFQETLAHSLDQISARYDPIQEKLQKEGQASAGSRLSVAL